MYIGAKLESINLAGAVPVDVTNFTTFWQTLSIL